MTDDYLKQVEAAYQGEVYGEAMYSAIAASMTDPVQAGKWHTLVELETRVKAVMRDVVARLGGDTTELESSGLRGHADAQKYIGLPWNELMSVFSSELDPVIAEYAALEKGCPPEDAPALRALTEHEVVAKAFCEREMSGQVDSSIEPVTSFLATLPDA
jgi:hypothetical protein